MATTAAWRTSRIYTDPNGQGRRLNIVAAAEVLSIRPGTFYRLQQDGFYQWQGTDLSPRKLTSLLTVLPEGGQSEETFLESEILQLREVFQSNDEERYGKMGRVNRVMVGRRLGISAASAQANGRFEGWEKEGKLTPSLTKSPMTGKRELTYPAEQMERLAAERDALRDRQILHQDGKSYLPTDEVCRQLGVTYNSLRLWTEHGITPLGGEKLDQVETKTLHGGKACWFEVIQIERIRIALESHRSARSEERACSHTEEHVVKGELYLTITAIYEGRGLSDRVPWSVIQRLLRDRLVKTKQVRSRSRGGRRETTVYHKGQIQEYLDRRKEPFDGIFELSQGRAFSLTRAVEELRDRWQFICSRWFLEQQIKPGGSPYLPEGFPPSVPNLIPSSSHPAYSGKTMSAIPEEQLGRLVEAIRQAVAVGNHLDTRWLDFQGIVCACKFDFAVRSQLGSLLKAWRESGELTHQVTYNRLWWDKRGQRRRVYIYFVPEIVRLANLAIHTLEQPDSLSDDAEVMPSVHSDGSAYQGPPLPNEF